MGREVRRVPENWEHPKDAQGRYISLSEDYNRRREEWDEGKEKWEQGLRDDWMGGWKEISEEDRELSYEEWSGERPEAKDYMPEWSESEKTHLQMYETCSEGSPISPVMATPEELAHWLADNEASAFGGMTASYEAWLATIKIGSSVSAVAGPGTGFVSGVEANLETRTQGD